MHKLRCALFLLICTTFLFACNQDDNDHETHEQQDVETTTKTEEVWQTEWDGDRNNFAEWLTKAKKVLEKMQAYVEGEDIDEDLGNLFLLQSIIEHYQFVHTSHLGLNGEAKENIDLYDEWESTPEEIHIAFDYMKKLIHDLDIAFNHNGVGDTYGVTYVLDGENVKDMEKNESWTGDRPFF